MAVSERSPFRVSNLGANIVGNALWFLLAPAAGFAVAAVAHLLLSLGSGVDLALGAVAILIAVVILNQYVPQQRRPSGIRKDFLEQRPPSAIGEVAPETIQRLNQLQVERDADHQSSERLRRELVSGGYELLKRFDRNSSDVQRWAADLLALPNDARDWIWDVSGFVNAHWPGVRDRLPTDRQIGTTNREELRAMVADLLDVIR